MMTGEEIAVKLPDTGSITGRGHCVQTAAGAHSISTGVKLAKAA
jgi:hypothetical protein